MLNSHDLHDRQVIAAARELDALRRKRYKITTLEQPYWVFVQPSLYRLKIGRNWIYQIQQIDPEIESRIGELERWFENHQARHRLGWLKGRRQSYRWCSGKSAKQKLTLKYHQREIARAYEIFPEIDPAASVRRVPTSLRRIFPTISGVAQCRGNELRPRRVQVQVLPPGLSQGELASGRPELISIVFFVERRCRPEANSPRTIYGPEALAAKHLAFNQTSRAHIPAGSPFSPQTNN